MAKRINPEELTGQEFTNKAGDKFKVLYYQFKQGANHCYDIQFLETGAIQLATRNQILKGTVQDLEKRKKIKRIQTELKLRERNRLVKKVKTTFKPSYLAQKRVLALDLSTTSSGVSYSVENEIKRSKVIQSKSDNYKTRIYEIVSEIKGILEKGFVDVILIEDIYLGLNSKVLVMLSELRGALLYHAEHHGIEVVTVPAAKWKHFYDAMPVGRKEQKEFSIVKATEIMEREIETDDEADAVCMLHACMNMGEGL